MKTVLNAVKTSCVALLFLTPMLVAQHRIEGRVMTTDSLPVRNAVVLLRALSDSLHPLRTETDSLGSFSFEMTSLAAVPEPRLLRLDQNYPNPFSASTTLCYSLPSAGAAALSIHDLLGRRVRLLGEGIFPGGEQRTTWDGLDEAGRVVATGVYFAVLRDSRGSRTRMLVRALVQAPLLPGMAEGSPPPAAEASVVTYRVDIEATGVTLPAVRSRSNAWSIAGDEGTGAITLDYESPEDLGFPSSGILSVFFDAPYLYVCAGRNGLWRRDVQSMTSWMCLGLQDSSMNGGGVQDVDARGTTLLAGYWPDPYRSPDSTSIVYRSSDGGITWLPPDSSGVLLLDPAKHQINAVTNIRRSPHAPDTVIALRGGTAVFRSPDVGRTWVRLRASGDEFLGREMSAFWWHPYRTGVLFFSMYPSMDSSPPYLLRMTAFGELAGPISDKPMTNLAFSSTEPDRIFASMGSMLYESPDCGVTTWSMRSKPGWPRITRILHDFNKPILYAQGAETKGARLGTAYLWILRDPQPAPEVYLPCGELGALLQDTHQPYLYGWLSGDRIVRMKAFDR
jgi:hypothetical protein